MGKPAWEHVKVWRREQRASLLALRTALSLRERRRVDAVIVEVIKDHFPQVNSAVVGFYWPFKGEVDLRGLMRDSIDQAASGALPVVVEKKQPLEFWVWHPELPLKSGVWGIPIPAERNVVRPSVLLVPLVGFDDRGYRLGYGGGYYDRTLASFPVKPLSIGVGYELGRLRSIFPQPHDIPMDAIITEAGLHWSPHHGNRQSAKASRSQIQ